MPPVDRRTAAAARANGKEIESTMRRKETVTPETRGNRRGAPIAARICEAQVRNFVERRLKARRKACVSPFPVTSLYVDTLAPATRAPVARQNFAPRSSALQLQHASCRRGKQSVRLAHTCPCGRRRESPIRRRGISAVGRSEM